MTLQFLVDFGLFAGRFSDWFSWFTICLKFMQFKTICFKLGHKNICFNF